MKKNFFKKLSFVLALAMIVTALAPAAGAFAAKAPKLNASSKYLYLGVDKKDEFDFNISNKVTGWKYLWTSANEDVASVNKKNGLVTAEAAGKTKISVVITDKKGEEVDELTATVTVRDNIKTLTITNLPTDGKVAVGVAHDFNRSYVTVANKTKGSEGVTRWSVSPSEGATISDMGVFTATKAGEYTITARAFQSKSKYTSWLTDATKYASYVTSNEATYKVTVAASMVSAKQVNLKKFDLAFDTAMVKDDITKNIVVYYVLGGTKVKESVKGISMSDDNKTATVEMNYDFTKGTTYVVEYPNMKSVEFVSATTKVEDVVDMAIKTKTAQLSKEQKLDIALLNKDGVNIANEELLGRITSEKSDNNYAYLDGARVLYMHKLGEVVKVTATYHTYNWKDGKEIGNVTATGEVTCVEVSKDVAGSLYAWTIKDFGAGNEPTNFTTTKTTTFKDANQQLYVVLKGKDSNGDDMYTSNFTYTGSPSATRGPLAWKYTSSNESVLFVDSTGRLYGVKEGTATVVVSYNDVQVGACEISVAGARKAAMASLSKSTLTLSNAFSDDTKVTFEVKDQFGDDYKRNGAFDATATIALNGSYSNSTVYPAVEDADDGVTDGVIIDASGATSGTYNYIVKVKDGRDGDNVINLPLSVSVQQPSNRTPVSYRLDTNKNSYDIKSGDNVSSAEVELYVYAYNNEGVKVDKISVDALEALGSRIDVKKAGTVTGAGIIDNQNTLTGTIDLVSTKTISGGARTIVSNEKTGAWTITATNTTGGKAVTSVGFEVKNTQAKVEKSVKHTVSEVVGSLTDATLEDVINDCLSFTAGDKRLYAEESYLDLDRNYYISDKKVSLKKIKLYDATDDLDVNGNPIYIEYEIDLTGTVLYIK